MPTNSGALSLTRPSLNAWVLPVSKAFCATLFIAVCAHISFPLPFTPVPLTLQPFAVLLIGLLMSAPAAFATLCLYLAEGAAGLPVFTPHSIGGVAHLFGPNGGFLIAYPVIAALAAWSFSKLHHWRSTYAAAAVAASLATALLFIFGAAWLKTYLHLSLQQTWIAAIAPFLPGEVVKICSAAGIASAIRSARGIK